MPDLGLEHSPRRVHTMGGYGCPGILADLHSCDFGNGVSIAVKVAAVCPGGSGKLDLALQIGSTFWAVGYG